MAPRARGSADDDNDAQEWVTEVEGPIVAELLDALARISEDNDHIEFLVGFSKGLKIEIFANEHPPPHFRVIYQGESNNFRIADCCALNGDALRPYFREIRKWHRKHKQQLIDTWDRTRPAGCPVGPYREKR